MPLSAAHCQAISDAHLGHTMGNGRPVDLTQPKARQGVCHCRCGCSSCYQKARRNEKAGRTGVPYCARM